jgi:hypothetical protein
MHHTHNPPAAPARTGLPRLFVLHFPRPPLYIRPAPAFMGRSFGHWRTFPPQSSRWRESPAPLPGGARLASTELRAPSEVSSSPRRGEVGRGEAPLAPQPDLPYNPSQSHTLHHAPPHSLRVRNTQHEIRNPETIYAH